MSTLLRELLRASVDRNRPTEPIDEPWSHWVDVAARERIVPLMYKMVSSGTSTPEQMRLGVEAAQLEIMGSMVRLEHELLEVVDALVGEGYECAVLKGSATAHLDYKRPEFRQSADLDLLVSPVDFMSAVQFLSGQGWKQAYPLPRHHEAFTHAITLRRRRGPEVDLHQRIAHRAVGWQVDTSELLANRCTFEVANTKLRALSDVDRTLHAALHDVMSRPPYHHLSSTADVLVLTTRHADLAEQVLEKAERFGVRRLATSAIERAYTLADLSPPDPWPVAMAGSHGRRQLLLERAYLGRRRRPLLEELAFVRVLGESRSRMRYITGYFTTDPYYAQHRQRSGIRAQSRYLWSRIRST